MAEAFKAGDRVKKSGIYSVLHGQEHAKSHDVTCMAGKTFPPCEECGDDVRFQLVRHAPNVLRHAHFMA